MQLRSPCLAHSHSSWLKSDDYEFYYCTSHDYLCSISDHIVNLIYFRIITLCTLFVTSIYSFCFHLKSYSKHIVHLYAKHVMEIVRDSLSEPTNFYSCKELVVLYMLKSVSKYHCLDIRGQQCEHLISTFFLSVWLSLSYCMLFHSGF